MLYISDFKKFQFHEGPIKTLGIFDEVTNETSFNSMKVRLKQDLTAYGLIRYAVSIP